MLLVEAEQEISNLNDISKLAILVVALILTSLGVYKLFFLLAVYVAKPIVSQTMLLAIYVLTPPTILSVLCGKYILHYLKGSTFNSNTVAVAIFDVAAFISFFFRFLLQIIRYVLVVIKFTLLHSLFAHHYSYRPPVIVMRLHPTLEDAKPFYFFEECWELQQELVHWVFELINVFVIYYAQVGAFAIVLFWLFSGLYSYAVPIAKVIWFKYKK